MIFNMVGSGGGAPVLQRARGTAAGDISGVLSITELQFEPVFLLFQPTSGTSSGNYFMFDKLSGSWLSYYGDNYGYAATNVTTTANSITVDLSGHGIDHHIDCPYIVMGYQ